MNKTRFRRIAIISTIFSLLTCTYIYSKLVLVDDKQGAYLESLITDFQHLDSQKNQEIVVVNQSSLSNYDKLASYLKQGKDLRIAFEESGILNPDTPAYVKNEAYKFLQTFDKKQEVIERYKSSLSIVRNSERFLPIAKDEALEEADKLQYKNGKAFKVLVEDAYFSTQSYLQSSAPGMEVRAQLKLGELESLLQQLPQSLRQPVNTFISHSKVLIQHKPVKEQYIAEIISDEMPTATRSLIRSYTDYINEINATDNYRFFIALTILMLLAPGAIFTAHRKLKAADSGNRTDSRLDNDLAIERTENERLTEENQMFSEENQSLKAMLSESKKSTSRVQLDLMAATLAHKINTPLSQLRANFSALDQLSESINNTLDEIEIGDGNLITGIQKLKENKIVFELPFILSDINEDLSGVETMAEQIKDYTRKDCATETKFDLNEVIKGFAGYKTLMVGHTAKLKINLSSGPIELFSDPAEIKQILTQLVKNALDTHKHAEKDNAIIEISTAVDDDTAKLTVRDNGEGMEEETRRQACDPFFSTRKQPTQQNGLGLTIVHSSVSRMNGKLKIASKLGKGTAVKVTLPLGNKLSEGDTEFTDSAALDQFDNLES